MKATMRENFMALVNKKKDENNVAKRDETKIEILDSLDCLAHDFFGPVQSKSLPSLFLNFKDPTMLGD